MSDNYNSRLDGLNNTEAQRPFTNSYSRFVKFTRWTFPIFALILMVVVIAWPELDQQIEAIPQEDILSVNEISMGSNQLVNPEYQTTDNQNNPVNIKASQATQSQNNKDLIRLEIPEANFQTKQGDKIFVRADLGTYDQSNEKLFLQNSVKIKHANDYTLNAEELRLNMKTQEAFSDKNITITGDSVELKANGVDGNMQSGELYFRGPGKIIFNQNKSVAEELAADNKMKEN